MEQRTSAADGAASPDQVKLCECGCGEPAPIATKNDRSNGRVKGRPMRFIKGHATRVRDPGWRQGAGAPRKLFVTAGQEIGRSIVIDPEVALPPSRGGSRGVRLRCECGREYVRKTTYLCSKPDNADESCGGCGSADLTGQQFGRLKVIRWAGTKADTSSDAKWQRRWLCLCKCKNEVLVTPSELTSGRVKSCGCGQTAPRQGRTPAEAASRSLLRHYQRGARDRGLAWELSDEDFGRLIKLDCHYCGIAPSRVYRQGLSGSSCLYTGIDRIDSSQPYRPDNVLPACGTCNMAKKTMSYEDFMAWIFRLVAYYFFHPELMPSRYLAGLAQPR